ncbi:glucose-1-phosphate adenylyltransferase [archaeon]|nr:glucose-1-phosphate adenylyltransferase [archaeon]
MKGQALVLGGGSGTRFAPISDERAKPATPFGSGRVMDWVLSNLYHSGIHMISVLLQSESRSAERHIRHGWYSRIGVGRDQEIKTLLPIQGANGGWYIGTADAISKNIREIEEYSADVVNILGADHIYMMDYSQMNQFHIDREAHLTISAIPVKRELAAKNYGVIVVDEDWRVIGWEEKPENPTAMPGNPDYCLASMGNYAFQPEPLLEELIRDAAKEYANPKTDEGLKKIQESPDQYSSHDFGFDVIPTMLRAGAPMFVYNLMDNMIPGLSDIQRGQWRDIGNIDEYYRAAMDMKGPNPLINPNTPGWEILTYAESHAPALISSTPDHIGLTMNSAISPGVVSIGAAIENSVIGYNVLIEEATNIMNSVIMGNANIGQHVFIKKAIIDKHVTIPYGTSIGANKEEDIARGFTVTDSGITVVPRGYSFNK